MVTGAGGFIGSHLCEALVKAGYKVKAFVLYNSHNSWEWLDHVSADVMENIEVILGDVRDPFGVRETMKGCDGVLHLAALIGIPYSYHSPQSYVDTNVSGTLNVVQAARDLGIERVVHTSTSEVYGTALRVPIDEAHPLQGQSPYSASKIGADQIALSYHRSFETPVVVARPFNTYGPRQSTRAVIPTMITQLAAGKKDLKLGALDPTRDFNYVTDTVNGFMSLLESDGVCGEEFNIGSNFEISIGETLEVISEVMGVDVKVEKEKERLRPKGSEVFRLWADNTKMINRTSWRPEFAGRDGFAKGISETVAWYRDPVNLACFKTDSYTV